MAKLLYRAAALSAVPLTLSSPCLDAEPLKIKSTDYSKLIQRCRNVVNRYKELIGAPGICVGVSVNGKTVWRQGFGYANLEQLTPCTEDTVMRIASISKPITMALVAELWQNGKIDLDAPVSNYLPDFPKKTFEGQEVNFTTRQLVSHLAGIPHYSKKKASAKSEAQNNKSDNKKKHGSEKAEDEDHQAVKEFDHADYYLNKHFKSITDSLKVFQHEPLVAKPVSGTKFVYSTHGWTLVSAVAEKAGGAPFVTQLKGMLQRFGMHRTYLDENKPIIPDRSRYYVRNEKDKIENVPEVNNSYKWAGGGLLSTVGDLLIFAHIMLYSLQYNSTNSNNMSSKQSVPFLKSETVQALWKPAANSNSGSKSKETYGMGWAVEPLIDAVGPDSTPWNRSSYTLHTGGAVGASSVLLVVPESNGNGGESTPPRGVCVAVLVNVQNGGNLTQLATDIAQEFLDFEK